MVKKQKNVFVKKYWLLILLPAFLLGYLIVRFVVPNTCGCGGGWAAPLHNPVLYAAPVPLWLGLASGAIFCALCVALLFYTGDKTKKIISVITVSLLLYICCICYAYFILPTTCPPMFC